MDFTEFFAIVEQDRDILNPISPDKLARVAGYAGLRDGLSVLDIGSGKGAVLRQWAQHWNILGTGLEINPAFVRDAQALALAEGVAERLTFWQGDARQFETRDGGYNAVTCFGAPFAIGSFSQAASWMRQRLNPGGVLILGDVYLKTPAPAEDVQREGWEALPTLAAMCAEFCGVGVELVGLVTSSTDDWDHYNSLMWSAVNRWQREHPEHPHRAEVLERVREGREKYLRWEREHLGWAVLVGRALDEA